jgi:hypothetical protein
MDKQRSKRFVNHVLVDCDTRRKLFAQTVMAAAALSGRDCTIADSYLAADKVMEEAECTKCQYKLNPDGGHCYMFKKRPKGHCGSFKPRM